MVSDIPNLQTIRMRFCLPFIGLSAAHSIGKGWKRNRANEMVKNFRTLRSKKRGVCRGVAHKFRTEFSENHLTIYFKPKFRILWLNGKHPPPVLPASSGICPSCDKPKMAEATWVLFSDVTLLVHNKNKDGGRGGVDKTRKRKMVTVVCTQIYSRMQSDVWLTKQRKYLWR